MTPMLHASNGTLRVALTSEDGAWFAQGLEVDYFAAGETLEEAEQNFQEGLAITVKRHLKKFGTLDRMKPTPPVVVREYYPLDQFRSLAVRKLTKVQSVAPQFPFDSVEFLAP